MLAVKFGDPGDYQPVDRVRVVELAVFDAKGTKISFLHDLERGTDDRSLVTSRLRLGDRPGGTYLAEARYDNGFYVHDGENRAVATTKEWLADPIDSAHYLKYAKVLFHVGAFGGGYDRIVGHRLEIVPLADPFAAKDGASVAFRVMFDAAELKDEIVEIGDDSAASKGPELRTDDHGIVRVKFGRTGTYRLAVGHRVPARHPDICDYDDYTASLVLTR